MSQSDAERVYLTACDRAGTEPIQAFVDALSQNEKIAPLQARSPPINDADLACIAAALRRLDEVSPLKILSLEENAFGLEGIQALMEAIEANPHRIREVRLGKNNLKDPCAIVIGQTLARSRCGLKVLDLSENGLTKLGVLPLAAALESEHCELVELSFHNNKIEGDAGAALANAMSQNTSLKHLHLGYNTLRDTGASAIAQAIPKMRQLATLDLTANRIGREGGAALAKALCDSRCGLQRLNLRHNLLDSEGIEAFEKVLSTNQSLIQLFLGFMSPTPDAAEAVLGALLHNHTLLLLDTYGWKLNQKRTLEIIQKLQRQNSSLAAIVTDACQPIAKQIDEGNDERDERGVHPLYVGPDDRDAYLATKSLKRFSRAQSRRQSRNTSRHRSQSATSERSRTSITRVRKASHGGPVDTPASSTSARRRRISPGVAVGSGGTPKAAGSYHHQNSGTYHSTTTPRQHGGGSAREDLDSGVEDKEITHLLRELDALGGCDRDTKRVIRGITEALLRRIQQQRYDNRSMLTRIEKLEARRECKCQLQGNASPYQQQQQPQQTPYNYSNPAASSRPLISSAVSNNNNNTNNNNNNNVRSPYYNTNTNSAYSNNNNNSQPTNSRAGFNNNNNNGYGSSGGSNGNASYPQQQLQHQQEAASSSYHQRNSSFNTSGIYGAYGTRSVSRGGYDLSAPDRAVTPLVHPSELHDSPPSLARPNEEGGEQRPEETSLQRSASVINFPPRIEPSPAQDLNPPRRKAIPSALIN